MLPWDVNAMVSSPIEMSFDALRECAEACVFTEVFTEVVMLRRRGRRIAIEAAMMPVPGSAVAHIVAFMVVARPMISWYGVE
jgi:predicted LPLAT superfamily acyltransferase